MTVDDEIGMEIGSEDEGNKVVVSRPEEDDGDDVAVNATDVVGEAVLEDEIEEEEDEIGEIDEFSVETTEDETGGAVSDEDDERLITVVV